MAEEDRISELPESLLLHILSFLSIKEIVRTSLLSQSWQLLWTEISEIHLVEESDDIGKIRSFVDWVGKMLVMSNGICLNKFSVDFCFYQRFASNVNLWVQFLVKNKVKNITLCFNEDDDDDEDNYKLPQILYSHSSLTSLTLSLCDMAPSGDIKWGFLKKLSLETVGLDDRVMEKILSGCPVLEFLHLRKFWGFNCLNITSPSLTTLFIEDFYVDSTEEEWPLEISAPYVLDLSIIDNTAGYDYVLKNVSSVVRAKVYFDIEKIGNIHEHLDDILHEHIDPSPTDYMNGLFDCLQSVKDLELGPWGVEVLSMWEVKGWKLQPAPRSCLTLNVWPHKRSIAGILGILKSSPNLETLVIKGTPFPLEVTLQVSESEEVLVATYLQNINLDSAAFRVKTIKISSFTDSFCSVEPMETLVQLLLKGATVLEKMVISAKELDIKKSAETLISFPRASSKAVIVLD